LIIKENKMKPVETISGMGRREIKNDRDEFNHDIL
jgi:hypothetical protein